MITERRLAVYERQRGKSSLPDGLTPRQNRRLRRKAHRELRSLIGKVGT